MSLGDRVGAISGVDLPEDFGTTTSWERAQSEDTSLSRISRAEWMVRVGDGNLHRVTFALEDGHLLGEGTCRGYQHHGWCAHLAALVLAYVRQEVEPADLATPVDEEVDALWARGRAGGEDTRRGDRR
jgi:hypothetical protein